MAAAALRCDVEQELPYALVRLSGPLDVAGAARVRATVLKCLAQQPTAVITDVSGLVVEDSEMLSVFRTLAHRAAMWPVVPLALCGPDDRLAAMLKPRATRIPLFPTVAAAAGALADPAVLPAVRDDVLPLAGAAARCRELVTQACVWWDLPGLLGPACSIVTEMVADSVERAGTVMNIQVLRTDRYLHLCLRDGGDADRGALASPSPDPGDVAAAAPDGAPWALALVNELAHRWGCDPAPEGRAIWAVLLI